MSCFNTYLPDILFEVKKTIQCAAKRGKLFAVYTAKARLMVLFAQKEKTYDAYVI